MDLSVRRFPVFFARCLAAISIVCIIHFPLFAQQKKADSLLRVLAVHHEHDTAYAEILNRLSFAYIKIDTSRAIQYNNMAIALAVQLHDAHALAGSYMTKGWICNYTSGPKYALASHLLALNQYKKLNNAKGLAGCYLSIAGDYHNVADNINSFSYGQKALDVALRSGDKLLIAQSYNSIGTSYLGFADYARASEYYYKELKIAEGLGNKSLIAKTTGNLGVVNYYLKRYPESLSYYKRCLDVLEEMGDKLWSAAALSNIGAVYLATKNYPEAISYNQKALAINRVVKSKKGEANDLMDMGVAYGNLKKYDSAFFCLNRSVAFYDTIGAKHNIAESLGHLADLYLTVPDSVLYNRGINPSQRLGKALQIQKEALNTALGTANKNDEADQWKNLGAIYERQKNYKKALESYRNYSNLNDSIFNDKKRNEITRLGIQYEFDKKEAVLKSEFARKQAELSRQRVIRNAVIAVCLILLVSAVTSFLFYKRRKDAREKQKEAEFRTQVAETEMKALRAQLNPHFIFNSLNSIGDYIAKHDKDTADIYLTRFAKLMRMILENSEHETISLADDLKTLELYMQLETLRLEHGFRYDIEVDDDIDPELTQVPPMLLQPFVENSIWHGIASKRGTGVILIRVKRSAEMIEYTVEDNGIGREKAGILKRQRNGTARRSFGIKVIQSRINIINETRNSNAKVELTDLEEGTKVSVKLPLDLRF